MESERQNMTDSMRLSFPKTVPQNAIIEVSQVELLQKIHSIYPALSGVSDDTTTMNDELRQWDAILQVTIQERWNKERLRREIIKVFANFPTRKFSDKVFLVKPSRKLYFALESCMGVRAPITATAQLKIHSSFACLNLSSLLHSTAVELDGINALCDAVTFNSSLTHLNLSTCKLGEKAGEALCTALSMNSSLTYLNISYNKLGEQAGEAIGRGLESNSLLTYLSLYSNRLGEQAGEAIGRGLESNSSLTYLNISYNQLGEQAGEAIGHALENNSSLTYLDISYNRFRERAREVIGRSLESNSSLTHLLMFDSKSRNINIPDFGGKGAEAIGRALEINSSITCLSLYFCALGKKGEEAILRSLKTNSSLKYLALSFYELPAKEFIVDALIFNSLTYFSLSMKSRSNFIPRFPSSSLTKLTFVCDLRLSYILDALESQTRLLGLTCVLPDLSKETGRKIAKIITANPHLTTLYFAPFELPEYEGQLQIQHAIRRHPSLIRSSIIGFSDELSVQEMEIATQIQTYLNRNSQNKVEGNSVHRSRVAVVGHGGAGKTSLIHWWKHGQGLSSDPPPTDVVEIDELTFPCCDGATHEVKCSVWDFGGQDMYDATHPLFLSTEPGVYLVVWNGRTDSQDKLSEWIKLIESLNYHFEEENKEHLDEEFLKSLRPKILVAVTHIDIMEAIQIEGFECANWRNKVESIWYVSNKTGEGVNELKEEIGRVALQTSPVPLPRSWENILGFLRQEGKENAIITQNFDWISRKCKVDRIIAEQAVDQYVSAGAFIRRKGILENKWILLLDVTALISIVRLLVSRTPDSIVQNGVVENSVLMQRIQRTELIDEIRSLGLIFPLISGAEKQVEKGVVPLGLPELPHNYDLVGSNIAPSSILFVREIKTAAMINRGMISHCIGKLWIWCDPSKIWKNAAVLRQHQDMVILHQVESDVIRIVGIGESSFVLMSHVIDVLIDTISSFFSPSSLTCTSICGTCFRKKSKSRGQWSKQSVEKMLLKEKKKKSKKQKWETECGECDSFLNTFGLSWNIGATLLIYESGRIPAKRSSKVERILAKYLEFPMHLTSSEEQNSLPSQKNLRRKDFTFIQEIDRICPQMPLYLCFCSHLSPGYCCVQICKKDDTSVKNLEIQMQLPRSPFLSPLLYVFEDAVDASFSSPKIPEGCTALFAVRDVPINQLPLHHYQSTLNIPVVLLHLLYGLHHLHRNQISPCLSVNSQTPTVMVAKDSELFFFSNFTSLQRISDRLKHFDLALLGEIAEVQIRANNAARRMGSDWKPYDTDDFFSAWKNDVTDDVGFQFSNFEIKRNFIRFIELLTKRPSDKVEADLMLRLSTESCITLLEMMMWSDCNSQASQDAFEEWKKRKMEQMIERAVAPAPHYRFTVTTLLQFRFLNRLTFEQWKSNINLLQEFFPTKAHKGTVAANSPFNTGELPEEGENLKEVMKRDKGKEKVKEVKDVREMFDDMPPLVPDDVGTSQCDDKPQQQEENIREFLDRHGLGKYADRFEKEEMMLQDLPLCDESHLEGLGMPTGPRLRLLKAIQEDLKKKMSS